MENTTKEFIKSINADIVRIDNELSVGTDNTRWTLFLYLNGMYQSCISDFYMGLRGASFDGSKFSLLYVENNPEYVKENLQIIQSKLKARLFEVNSVHDDLTNQTQVNINNYVSISVSFDQVRKDIENMSFLSNEETNDILKRITDIENILKSDEIKKKKWERVTPIIKWIADKSFDVGIALLPLVLKISDIN